MTNAHTEKTISRRRPFKKTLFYQDPYGVRHRVIDTQYMHLCQSCGDICVQLDGRYELPVIPGCSAVLIRCPNCGFRHADFYTIQSVDSFLERLYNRTRALIDLMEEVTEDNMEHEGELLHEALERNLIGANDFRL